MKGFTLIEVMVVVALIGVLAAIAIPAYRQYVVKATRQRAEATMISLAQMEERYYSNNYTYNAVSAPAPAPDPNGWSNFSGDSMGSRQYDILVFVPSPTSASASLNSFGIQATPSNGFTDSSCGSLTLDNMGVKGSALGSVASCW